jgi:hypothetical protein
MHLRSARLCLDCEEIHEDQQCPLCASESFAFLTRWIPSDKPRPAARPAAPLPQPSVANAARLPADMRWLRRGAAGVALIALGRWIWQRGDRPVDNRPVNER